MADRPALAAVLLDAGGTLVRLDFEWMAERLVELGVDADPERLRWAEVEGRRRFDASLTAGATASSGGWDPVRAYFGGMLEAARVPPARIAGVLEDFERRHRERGLWSRPMEQAGPALARIGTLGLRCAVVSNSDGRAELHLSECGMLDHVEFVVDSHRVGVEKPDPAIFRIALERLDVAPDRALFVGDIVSIDARGARAAGMNFVLLDPSGDYAPEGVSAIPHIGALPDWIVERYQPQPPDRVPQRDRPDGALSGGTP